MKDKPVLLPVGGSFEIEYVNAEGIGSRRIIDVRKFVANFRMVMCRRFATSGKNGQDV